MPATILSDNGASSGTAGLKTSGSNDGILELQTTTGGGTATAAITIDTAQRSKFPTTIGVGNATPATSGSGITFPASASASSDANTLDDYEEGTFTPTVAFGGASVAITYAQQQGFYTKIGNLVTCQIRILLSDKGSSSGAASIRGLPFTVAGGEAFSAMTARILNMSFADYYAGYASPGGTFIVLEEVTNAGSGTDLTNSDFANNTNIILSVYYRV